MFLVKDGQSSLVQGTYSFYHYGHGGFNDHQWGCAYRSLQTLYSWFKYVLTLKFIKLSLIVCHDEIFTLILFFQYH